MKKIEHQTFRDNRGSYTPLPLDTLGINWDQCSISINDGRYTFRGMHYQSNPPQEKYIKVIRGSIVDIGYDLVNGKTYHEVINTDEAVYLHDKYAHGFLTLEPDTIVAYLVKGDYSPEAEHSIVWQSIPEVKEIINMYTKHPIISEKDRKGK